MAKKPTKQNIVQFALYNVGGLAFFITGYAVFVLLYGVFSWQWWMAKIVADIVGWVANYIIQRYVAFRHESTTQRERVLIARFSIFSIANVPLDYAIVGGLKLLGISPFIGLWLSSLFFTIWKYVWYKRWVFSSRPVTQKK